jgi:hypothetical protein
MKTLTPLTAVAVLIAGMSIASAQAPSGMNKQNDSPSSLNKGSEATKDSGSQATNPSKMSTGKQVTGSGKFCVEMSAGGGLDCKYASLGACEKNAKPNNRQCSPNPTAGTTGSK